MEGGRLAARRTDHGGGSRRLDSWLIDGVMRDEAAPAEQALKPLFDLAWNGGSWPGSPFYTESGEWKPPR